MIAVACLLSLQTECKCKSGRLRPGWAPAGQAPERGVLGGFGEVFSGAQHNQVHRALLLSASSPLALDPQLTEECTREK